MAASLRFVANDLLYECAAGVCIVIDEREVPPVRFISSVSELAKRLIRAGADADAAKADRFQGGLDE